MWKPGRQNSGYLKKKLLESLWPIPHDLYLLKYPEGSFILPHKDPAPIGFQHWRINLILKKAKGGRFNCNTSYNFGRLFVFRSDNTLHSVSKVTSGCRFVLSLGLLIREK